jgi:hypothetical protein
MDDAQEFFSPQAFSDDEKVGNFIVYWYSRHLAAMREPSLWRATAEPDRHAYRFLWLRTFHPPIALRLEMDASGSGALTVKMTNGMGGYEPGDLVLDRSVLLSREQTAAFSSALAQARFWELPVRDTTHIGMDGAEWVIEGIRAGGYHVVTRWSPDEGAFREAALTLVRLANLEIAEIY